MSLRDEAISKRSGVTVNIELGSSGAF